MEKSICWNSLLSVNTLEVSFLGDVDDTEMSWVKKCWLKCECERKMNDAERDKARNKGCYKEKKKKKPDEEELLLSSVSDEKVIGQSARNEEERSIFHSVRRYTVINSS